MVRLVEEWRLVTENREQQDLETKESGESENVISFEILGVPSSAVRDDIKKFASPIENEDGSMTSESVGEINVTSGIITILAGLGSGLGGSGEGILLFLVILFIVMSVFSIVWVFVMIAFSIFTLGGFFKRRHITVVSIKKRDDSFVSKLVVASVLRGGVLYENLGDPDFDDWLQRAQKLYQKMVHIRWAGLLAGTIWGIVEIAFKGYNILHPTFHYDLWPFRILMVSLFLPMIFYSAWIELRLRRHYSEGDLVVHRLMASDPVFNPEQPLPGAGPSGQLSADADKRL
ncbi:MAG: hypothetical protein K9W43_11040 [Candidatus Thorarchaeota archaeon]|nr:hypothetical protein [Candidatus Thorarchaeota archaeon]